MSKIDHVFVLDFRISVAMKAKKAEKPKKPTIKQVLAVRCLTSGAGTDEKCELSTRQPRTEPHRDRTLDSSGLNVGD